MHLYSGSCLICCLSDCILIPVCHRCWPLFLKHSFFPTMIASAVIFPYSLEVFLPFNSFLLWAPAQITHCKLFLVPISVAFSSTVQFSFFMILTLLEMSYQFTLLFSSYVDAGYMLVEWINSLSVLCMKRKDECNLLIISRVLYVLATAGRFVSSEYNVINMKIHK